VAIQGNSKVQRLTESQSSQSIRDDVGKQGPQQYDAEDNDEDDRGSILCHERLAIVGIGEYGMKRLGRD